MKFSEIINSYLSCGHTGSYYSLDEEFCIVDNPSFNIIPDNAYRSPFVVAVYCRNGYGKGRINAQEYNLEPQGFFIVLPGQITEFMDVSPDFEATYIIMTSDFTESLSIGNTFNLRNIITRHPYNTLGERACTALDAYLTMCKSLIPTKSNPHRAEILRLMTRAFFLGLGYFMHEQNNNTTQSRAESITEEFIQLVEDNYRTHRDLAFYASHMGLTSKHLSTTVKRTSGRSAMEWIERYVIVEASLQLRSTKHSIKQIAYDLNFPSQSFFGKYFSRIVGLSPAKYRRKHQR